MMVQNPSTHRKVLVHILSLDLELVSVQLRIQEQELKLQKIIQLPTGTSWKKIKIIKFEIINKNDSIPLTFYNILHKMRFCKEKVNFDCSLQTYRINQLNYIIALQNVFLLQFESDTQVPEHNTLEKLRLYLTYVDYTKNNNLAVHCKQIYGFFPNSIFTSFFHNSAKI